MNDDAPRRIAPGLGPLNELDVELQLRAVVLRDFRYELRPLLGLELRPGVFVRELDGMGAGGLELRAVAEDTGLTVSLRFERGEFVNLATGGLAMLDAADAGEPKRGEEVN